MFKGLLKLAILKVLSEGPQTGYGIRKILSEKAGWSPSCGALFPALKELESRGLITLKRKGNRNEYFITRKGRSTLSLLKRRTDEVVKRMIRNMETFGFLWDVDKAKINEIKYIIKNLGSSYHPPLKSLDEFQHVVINFFDKAKMDKKKMKLINKVISKATADIKKILREKK